MRKFALLFYLLLLLLKTKKLHCWPQSETEDSSVDEEPGAESDVPSEPESEPAPESQPEPQPEPAAEPEPVTETVTPPAEVAVTSPIGDVETTPAFCDETALVSCFMASLSDWAWHLWSFKENIISSNNTVCERHYNLSKCVHEMPHCTIRKVLNVSAKVSDLILHRRDAGTFLKPYFLTTFACTEEGKQIVEQNRGCLIREHISAKLNLHSATLENNIREFLNEDLVYGITTAEPPADGQTPIPNRYCTLLMRELDTFYQLLIGECNVNVAYLICKSLTDTFKSIFPDQLESCFSPCTLRPTTIAPLFGDEVTQAGGGQAASGEGQQPPASDDESGKAGDAVQQNGVVTTTNSSTGQKKASARLLLLIFVVIFAWF